MPGSSSTAAPAKFRWAGSRRFEGALLFVFLGRELWYFRRYISYVGSQGKGGERQEWSNAEIGEGCR